jgi:hypothetical protein
MALKDEIKAKVAEVVAEKKAGVVKEKKLSAKAKATATKSKSPFVVPTVSVRRLYKEGKVVTKETEDEIMLDIELPHPEASLAQVGFNARMTINLGDFESVQLGVSCVLPCYVEELSEAFVAAKQFVDLKLNTEVGAVRDYRKEKDKDE